MIFKFNLEPASDIRQDLFGNTLDTEEISVERSLWHIYVTSRKSKLKSNLTTCTSKVTIYSDSCEGGFGKDRRTKCLVYGKTGFRCVRSCMDRITCSTSFLCKFLKSQHPWLIVWCLVFCAVSTIFQPYNSGSDLERNPAKVRCTVSQ